MPLIFIRVHERYDQSSHYKSVNASKYTLNNGKQSSSAVSYSNAIFVIVLTFYWLMMHVLKRRKRNTYTWFTDHGCFAFHSSFQVERNMYKCRI